MFRPLPWRDRSSAIAIWLSRASATTIVFVEVRCRSEAPPELPQALKQQAEAEGRWRSGRGRSTDGPAHPRFPLEVFAGGPGLDPNGSHGSGPSSRLNSHNGYF